MYSWRGMSTVSSVSPSRRICWAVSRAARGMRRSGHSMMSSGKLLNPRSLHALTSRLVFHGSRSKWTARNWSGCRVRAYWMARAAAASRLSTRTMTLWVAHGARLGERLCVLVQLDVFGFIGAVHADQAVDHDRDEQDDHPGALAELDAGDDHQHQQRQQGADRR